MHTDPIKIIDPNQAILIFHKSERRKWIIGHEAFIGSHVLLVVLESQKLTFKRYSHHKHALIAHELC